MLSSVPSTAYKEATPRVQKMLDEETSMLFEGTSEWHCRLCGKEAATADLHVTGEGLAVCPTDGCPAAGWSDLMPVGHVYRTTS
jgi:hypothetical protein